nr:hypothetical protein [Polyangium jinanense]
MLLVRDHAEAPPCVTRARGLDRRVDGEVVRLLGELADDVHDAPDLLRSLVQAEHVRHDQIDLLARPLDGLALSAI